MAAGHAPSLQNSKSVEPEFRKFSSKAASHVERSSSDDALNTSTSAPLLPAARSANLFKCFLSDAITFTDDN